MKQTVNEYDFRCAFETMRPENFSYEGLGLLYEYFTDQEDDIGEEMDFDCIAICCDWAESDAATIVQDFGLDDVLDLVDADPASEEYQRAVLEHLQNETSVAGVTSDGGIVYQSY